MKKKITARPCKEENNWEIENQNGTVMNKHYASKQSCVNAARRMANEFGCELVVEETTNSSQNKATQNKSNYQRDEE